MLGDLVGGIDVSLVSAAILVAVGSYVGVALMRFYAPRVGFFDIPNERSSHSRPVPSGGGLAVVLITLVTWWWFLLYHPSLPMTEHTRVQHALLFVLAGGLVASISLIDDLGHVPIGIRLAVHIAAAALFVAGVGWWATLNLPILGWVPLGIFGIVVSMFWIVSMVNAFNFVDGLDGMAGGQAAAAGLGWAALGFATGHFLIEALGALLAAASLGFLVHNWQPARIFMGDVGSTFFGFCFAVLPILAARYDPRLALAGMLLVWPALFDSGFTMLRRLRRGENVFSGHREFLFHRLVAAGWSHAAAASLYFTLPLLGAGLAFTWQYGSTPLHILVTLAVAALCIGLWGLVRHQEMRHDARRRLRIVPNESAPAEVRVHAEIAAGK